MEFANKKTKKKKVGPSFMGFATKMEKKIERREKEPHESPITIVQ